MDQATSTVLAAAIGAFAGIGGGLCLEAFKRRRERQGVAMALAGAIETELHMITRRGHMEAFKGYLDRMERGEALNFYGFVKEGQSSNLIVEAYLDRFGMLGGELPSDCMRYFQTTWGIRVDAARLVAGELSSDPAVQMHVIRQDLAIMAEMEVFGRDLARRLRRSAGY